MQNQNSLTSVFKNPGFLNLWINQILVQLAYNSLNFALIIWVFRLTDSNTAVSALMVAVYLPAVIFGLFGGLLVDITDRRTIIRLINILLSLSFLSLIFGKESLPFILTITFFINCLSQFYSPAESSAIPLVVKKEQLFAANSIFSTTLYIAFLLGFGLAGPLINLFDINLVFLIEAVLAFVAFLLTFTFPSIKSKADEQGLLLRKALEEKDINTFKKLARIEIGETLRLIRGRLVVLFSILILAGVQVMTGILAVLIPSFFERVVQIDATHASYVLVIPLGLGMVVGGFLISRFGQKIPRRILVGRAIFFSGILFALVGLAPLISPVINYFPKPRPLPFFYQPPLSAILATGSFMLGMLMVSIIVPSQTVLQENTPEEDRGKVFAVLNALMMGLSLLPVLFIGILADIFGSMPIFIMMGGVIIFIGLFGLRPSYFIRKSHLSENIRSLLGPGHWKN